MVTNNFKKILLGYVLNSSSELQTGPTALNISVINKNGSSQDVVSTAYSGTNSFITINMLNHIKTTETNGYLNISCGTGTSEATEDDYCLEIEESTNLTCDSVSNAFTSALTKTFTATFSNTSSDDIDVTEIGLFGKPPAGYSSGTVRYDQSVLLDRTVLSTPITIPAGQSKAITYEIAF